MIERAVFSRDDNLAVIGGRNFAFVRTKLSNWRYTCNYCVIRALGWCGFGDNRCDSENGRRDGRVGYWKEVKGTYE